MTKFWYSANQKKWQEYVAKNPLGLSCQPPSHGNNYALIDGRLVEYTECHTPTPETANYAPDYDDVVFLGVGVYACNDWNIQMYRRNHPEVQVSGEEWPETIEV